MNERTIESRTMTNTQAILGLLDRHCIEHDTKLMLDSYSLDSKFDDRLIPIIWDREELLAWLGY